MSFEKGDCSGGSCEIKGFAPEPLPSSGSNSQSSFSEESSGNSRPLAGFAATRAPAKRCAVALFYSEFCGPCAKAKEFIRQENLVDKIPQKCLDMQEIDHSDANYDEWERLALRKCNGVPFFVNRETGRGICGFSNAGGDFAEAFMNLAQP